MECGHSSSLPALTAAAESPPPLSRCACSEHKAPFFHSDCPQARCDPRVSSANEVCMYVNRSCGSRYMTDSVALMVCTVPEGPVVMAARHCAVFQIESAGCIIAVHFVSRNHVPITGSQRHTDLTVPTRVLVSHRDTLQLQPRPTQCINI